MVSWNHSEYVMKFYYLFLAIMRSSLAFWYTDHKNKLSRIAKDKHLWINFNILFTIEIQRITYLGYLVARIHNQKHLLLRRWFRRCLGEQGGIPQDQDFALGLGPLWVGCQDRSHQRNWNRSLRTVLEPQLRDSIYRWRWLSETLIVVLAYFSGYYCKCSYSWCKL